MKWILLILLIGCTPAVINGVDGEQGEPGIPGADGSDGIDGSAAAIGETGPTGPAGPTGSTGAQGIQGEPGAPGVDGIDGVDGTGSGWILRDRDGNQMDYAVSPGEYTSQMFGKPQCVKIIADDQGNHINMEFDLTSGSNQPCMENHSSWQIHGMKFADIDCESERHTAEYSTESIILVIGGTYYPTLPGIVPVDYYEWDDTQRACMRRINDGSTLYRYEPVPTSALALMQDAPYSLDWE